MAKKLGNDYMLWVESAQAGTFNVIKGQQSLSISRDADTIDTSTKDDSGYGTSAPGLKKLKITLDMLPNLPDADGFSRLEGLCNTLPAAPFNVQIRKGGATGAGLTAASAGANGSAGTAASAGDVVFAGFVYGNLSSTDFGQNEAVKAKAEFTAAAAPSIDKLA